MLKKIFLSSVITAFVLCGAASFSSASDAGPADITIVSSTSKKPKPAIFPHKQHQDAFKCAECHHQMKDGKQAP